MALINCPKCGHKISDRAAKCPHCGTDFTSNVLSSTPHDQSGVASRHPGRGNKNNLVIILVSGVITLVSVLAIYFYFENKYRQQTSTIVEQARLDSIKTAEREAARREAIAREEARIDSLRQDSIRRDRELFRLNASVFIEKIRRESDNHASDVYQNPDWEKRLKSLGFKGSVKFLGRIEGDYDEMVDSYSGTFVRTDSEGTITIKYSCDEYTLFDDFSWSITFTNEKQKEAFIQSLYAMGYKKQKGHCIAYLGNSVHDNAWIYWNIRGNTISSGLSNS